jgi:sugar lactone lactonase YvrE
MRVEKVLFFLLSVLLLSMIDACGISIISNHSISGTVTQNGSGLSGVTVSLSGTSTASTTTDANGNYSFGDLAKGSYTITPSLTGDTFSPSSSSQTVNNTNISGVDFTEGGPTAEVTTLAGSGAAGFTNGPGTSASFDSPNSIATDGTNLYVADSGNNVIREIVIATGQVTTLAGSGTPGFTNGPGTSAAFTFPDGIATDGTNLYVADSSNNAIREIVIATGQVTTLAGSGAAGFTNGAGTSASFNSPNSIATDGTNLYVADSGNNAIREIVIATGQVTTLAGSGAAGFTNGAGTSASFNSPNGIATDGTNLYVADSGNNVIREIVIATGQVTTLAGSGAAGFTNGAGTSASFNSPNSIATDGTNLYVADSGNNAIREIVIATGQVTTLAGSGAAGFTNGAGTSASFNSPNGIAITVSTAGTNLYLADTVNSAIREIQLR